MKRILLPFPQKACLDSKLPRKTSSTGRLGRLMALLFSLSLLYLANPISQLHGQTACWTAWNSSTAYTSGSQISYAGENYQAAFWTQNQVPSSNSGAAGSGQPWIPEGSCSGGGSATPTPTASSGCTATTITPYIQVNGGSWQQTASATVSKGASVNLGPQPTSGSWSWTGPNGYTSTSRQIGVTVNSTSTYTATYTNSCGAKSTQAFTLTVTGSATPTPTVGCAPTTITPYIQVNGGSWLQTASTTVSAGASVNLGPQPATGGISWSWTGPNGYTSNSRQISVTVSSTSTYTATYTNSCGAKSTQAFTLTVTGSATPTPTVGCAPTTITPYIQVNGGSWMQTASTTVSAGASVNIGPQPATGGISWSWTGPNGYTSNSRQISVTVSSTSTYTATYTNSCGAKSSQAFTLTVNGGGNGIIGDCGMDTSGAGTGQVDYVEVYSSAYAKWCVDTTYWAANQQYISQFFNYYDGAVAQLISLFNVQPPLPIVVEVTTPTGGACDCGGKFGEAQSVVITGDAYSDVFNNPQNNQAIPGFWGYLLTLHETINVFTGQVSGGWPTDWWADHRSPFPNAMDEQVMKYIGTQQNNQTLSNAAQAQHERFADPSISGYDSEVAMFDNFFNQYGGFPAYSKFFQLAEGDKLSWPSVSQDTSFTGDDDYSALLSEYVAAYLGMGFGTSSDLTSTFTNAGVGTLDTTEPSYTISSSAILGVANAHCSIRAASGAGVNVSSQLSQLQSGNYQNAKASGGNQSTCPSECSWNGSACVAKW